MRQWLLTCLVVFLAWGAWFAVGYWAINANQSSWAFWGIDIPASFFIIIGAILVIKAIWQSSKT